MADLTVVIPVGPDDDAWRVLVPQLLDNALIDSIVLSACQRQPEDSVLDNPRSRWIVGEAGRAVQLNRGIQAARTGYVWLLHADSRLNSAIFQQLAAFIQHSSPALGYFELHFADDGPRLTRLNARLANWRSRCLGLPFGDQGFVMAKSLVEQLGGFDETVTCGEDLDFVIRARHTGIKLQALPATLESSARRYQTQGWLTTSLRHIYLTVLLAWQAKQRLAQS